MNNQIPFHGYLLTFSFSSNEDFHHSACACSHQNELDANTAEADVNSPIHQPAALQIKLLGQASSHLESKKDYFKQWDAWKNEGGASGENRSEAVRKMKAWLKPDSPSAILNLSGLGLTSLPENFPSLLKFLDVSRNQLTSLPENLTASLSRLEASHNQLTSLPENLPASLESLDVSHNQLTSLSENLPGSLENLNVSHNQLTTMPENLPASLWALNVSLNQLTSLPENLPAELWHLNAENNQLISLPENITTQLGIMCTVELDDNPLPDMVRRHLYEAVHANGYCGPRFHFSMPPVSHNVPVRPLMEAVAEWYEEGAKDASVTTWSAFAQEKGASEFSRFLDRLRGTVNYGNPAFRKSVVEWLSHLAKHPQLRHDTFLVSLGATASCEDRVSLTLNEMKKVRLAADIENGHYDDRLPELLGLAKGMFRLDQLEKIAREKVASLRFVDEIEVYLAYQVKLRDALALPVDTPDMRFFGVSYVTEEDLAQADQRVREAEEKGFMHYLSTDWQPWQSVLKRLYAENHGQAQKDLIQAMEKEFETTLSARLTEAALENDEDARRIAGAQVRSEITDRINEQLTKSFLQSKDLLPLLEH